MESRDGGPWPYAIGMIIAGLMAGNLVLAVRLIDTRHELRIQLAHASIPKEFVKTRRAQLERLGRHQ